MCGLALVLGIEPERTLNLPSPSARGFSATTRIEVDPGRVLNRIAPAMYGACLEDVNHEIYGGLYAQRIYGESFEEPAPGTHPAGWRRYDGDWTPDGAGIHVRGGNGAKLVCEAADLGDGDVETELVVPHDLGENAGLLVRVSEPGVGADEFNGYEVAISPKRRTLILGKHRRDFKSLQVVDAPVVPGRWHRLRVALNGSRIRVYVDAETEPRIDYIDRDVPLTGRGVALRSWQSDASFRKVRIGSRAIPTDLAGSGVSRMWDRVLTGAAQGRFAVEAGAFNGALCQRIEHRGGTGRVGVVNRGLNRWGISVRKGHPMEGRIYLRGDVPSATVALQSADGSRTYASQVVPVGRGWGRSPFQLKSRVTDPNARFVAFIDRAGSLWADQAVLLDAPQDRFRGLPIRKDIAQELQRSGVTFLRYGGTMVNMPGYRWKDMIGDPDRRPPYAGHWYACSTNGFGIFDFLNFCERAGFRSSFAINVDETPEDAADLADYLTAPVNTPWGRRRAADGHPAPYQVDYLEIGNEEGIGNPDGPTMARYAERFRVLSRAIHARNPKIKLVCGAWWVPDAPHMKTVFDAIDGVAAAWDFHFWCDDPNAGKTIDRELERAQALFRSWNPKTSLKAVVFEENGNRHDLQRALGHATTVNATRRNGDFVLVDCAANALQPYRQNDNGWDQGGVFFTPDRVWSEPPAEVRRLLSRDHLPLRVAVRVEGRLDVLAMRSEDGRSLVLTVVNVSEQPVEAALSLGSFRSRSVRVQTVGGEANTVSGNAYAFPPRSVTSLRFSNR